MEDTQTRQSQTKLQNQSQHNPVVGQSGNTRATAARNSSPAAFSAEDLERYRILLEERAENLEASIQGLDEQSKMDTAAGSGDLNTVRTHPADQGTQMADQERNIRVADLETQELDAIQFALRRIQEGGYGLCAECGEPIPRVRLDAIPWAALDVRCQSELESQEYPMVTRQI